MSETADVLVALATLVTAGGAVVMSYRNSRKLVEQAGKIEVVHKATNSMKDELVAEVRAAALAKGLKEGAAMKSKSKGR